MSKPTAEQVAIAFTIISAVAQGVTVFLPSPWSQWARAVIAVIITIGVIAIIKALKQAALEQMKTKMLAQAAYEEANPQQTYIMHMQQKHNRKG